MKRNLDLARQIMLAMEEARDDEIPSIRLKGILCNDVELSHHVRILDEAGLIHAIQTAQTFGEVAWMPHSLTWHGHEFVELVRDNEIWAATRAKIDGFPGVPFAVVRDVAMGELRRRMNIAA